MAKFKIEGTGVKHSKRITRDGELVAMAEQFSNGKWSLYRPNDDQLRMTDQFFENVNEARNWVKENLGQPLTT